MKLLAWLSPLIAATLLGPLALIVAVAGVVAPAVVTPLICGGTDDLAVTEDGWRPPLSGRYTATSAFGPRFHPIHREWRMHTGQDLASTSPPGTVVAAAAGTIVAVEVDSDYGNLVTLRHPGRVVTRYAHLATVDPTLEPGATVEVGQRLGVEGATGTSTGIHLHFQVEIDNHPVDPVPFMRDRGAPLDGRPASTMTSVSAELRTVAGDAGEGGIGFALPKPGRPRQDSLRNPPLPIPATIKRLYVAAADRYRLPWTLLAGIGMEETGHGRNSHTSWAGARGLMQFMPATFAAMSVDGDGDGRTDILNDADSVYSAANYLTRSGVSRGPAGVRRALYAYNPTDKYVNDVLYYAHHYGGGAILGDPQDDCPPESAPRSNLPPLPSQRIGIVLAWANKRVGQPYRMGANGPRAYDCSSFTQTAYAQIGIRLPRTAAAQRNWLAAGHGTRITPGHEQPGDLVFWDSYLGPNQIGHVMIIWNPASKTTIEAHNTRTGIGHFSYADGPRHHIYEIWRVGDSPQASDQTGGARPHTPGRFLTGERRWR